MNNWVDVNMYVPEKGQRVLTFSPKLDETTKYRIVCYGTVSKGFSSETKYWQPLPEPPKEKPCD